MVVVAATGYYFFFFCCFPKSKTVVYGSIFVIIPAAIVLPPYLKANLAPSWIANGKFNLTLIVKLSPGIAIFVFYGKAISAAESAVL